MEDNVLLEVIERYLNGSMLEEEKNYFEQLRRNTPEVDQMVVEHKLFLQQMDTYAEHRNLKNTLHEMHARLLEKGDVNEGGEMSTKGRVIQMWHRYKRVTAIAASIAGITALVISGLISYLTPNVNQSQIQQLSGDIQKIKHTQQVQNSSINELKNGFTHIPVNAPVISSGTGFLIDGKGYLITNAHVLKGTSAVVVNNNGDEFLAKIINIDLQKDLAVLKITDADFKPVQNLPYSLKKSNVDLGEELFTLGYPRDEIVYNLGYLSAISGYNGDTSSCQISLSANPGNSGGPVFNKNGEVVGIVSAKQVQAEGVVFAVKSREIFKMIDDLKKDDTSIAKIKLPVSTSLKGTDRVNQIKEVQDYVYLVKAYNNNNK